MILFKSSLFIKKQRHYKKRYGIDIADLLKNTAVAKPDFKAFEDTHLLRKQREVLRDIEKHRHTKIVLSGGIASGKTFLACYLFIKNLLENRALYLADTNNFILGNSAKAIEVNLLGQFEKVCSLLKIPFVTKKANTSHILIDGLRVNLYGGDKTTDYERFRGSNTSLVYVNEATTLHKDTLLEALKRLRHGQEVVIFDTNPDHPAHFFKTDYIDKTDVYKTYTFTTYDNAILSKSFIKTQENLYKSTPTYKARVLYGEWVASQEAIFSNIVLNGSYMYKSPICYIDPSFSMGSDNTAVCVLEQFEDKFYAFIYQEKRPVNDSYVISTIKAIIEKFNVSKLYIEERDNTQGLGMLTSIMLSLRDKIETHYFSIAPVKPKSNKFARICTLIPLFSYAKLEIMEYSSASVFTDIYAYRGDNTVCDDALDSLSCAYLLLNLNRKKREVHFSKLKYF
ncbi:PBSX family phage terminase large subunit (plasmid) [Borrelia turcica IST7]|uniref:PBSX family phage terminase large subunit n=1 Tax=Borrelia turcica IST7 TaxID=1104446 RepID=A0A386PQZ7_9SPIR|nr:PBSX family phage terminase large subunit [Borrelia turcica]AYE37113.1 PBSX family phage terminase large subunit [Borrelia turcica IST7]